ncbi:MAG: PAS domain S-box protein [Acidobacteriota bacterium]|nr:PAS domain S-box protein [Acidobacteriota bacterium]
MTSQHAANTPAKIILPTAEEKLEESQQWLAAVFNASRDAIMVEDNGIIVYVNKSHAEMFGYDSQEELLGKSAATMLPDEEAKRLSEYGKARLRGETAPAVYEFKVKRKDGSLLDAEASVSTAVISGKKYIIAVTRDITKRKRAQKAIKESEERYRALVSASDQVVWCANADGEAEFAFTTWHKLTGQTKEEMLNWGWLDALHPECRERSARLWKEALETKGVYADERRVRLRDGSYRVFQVRGVPVFDEDGHLREWVGTDIDITERKQAEEKQKRRTAQIALRADINAALADGNLSLQKMLVRCAEAIVRHLGVTLACIWTLDKDERALELKAFAGSNEILNKAADKQILVGVSEIGLIASERRSHIVNDFQNDTPMTEDKQSSLGEKINFAGYPLIIEDKLLGVMGNYCDREFADDTLDALSSVADIVSQCIIRKLTEEALSKSENQLRQAQKLESIGRLAGGIAHDFNNMLTAINGYSELTLKRLKPDDPLRRNINEIKKAGERSALLTNQLLAFSRQQILQPEILDINQVVDDTINLLKRLIGEDIQLVTVLNREVGRVKADPGQLSQVIMNLVVNARDAMPAGGQLTIETADFYFDEEYASQNPNVAPGAYVMLAVSDNGSGMDAETQQHIFEPFFTTKEIGKGTGLGLATVYGVVKQSGGNIAVYSEPGVGTTFKVFLPKVKDAAEETDKHAPAVESARGTERILVVEDDDIVRALTQEILEMYGYRVFTARNGVEALDICKQQECNFDLLVTDVVMPQMGGRRLAESLTEKLPKLRILFTSGYADDAIIRHGVIETSTNFIQKPFTTNALAQKVREILDADKE